LWPILMAEVLSLMKPNMAAIPLVHNLHKAALVPAYYNIMRQAHILASFGTLPVGKSGNLVTSLLTACRTGTNAFFNSP
jgi:hypothetical protein